MRCSLPRSALSPTLADPSSEDDLFHNVIVDPIAAFCYESEATDSQGKHVNMTWATKLAKSGASLAPPPSVVTMPFEVTPVNAKLDAAIRNMLLSKVFVDITELRAAFPLIIVLKPDGTYDAVQDFTVWEPRYPRRNYVKLLVSPQTIQRISPLDKMIKIKLTNLFGQLSISAEMQQFCGVHYRGRYFAMTRLPPRHPRSAHIAQRWVEVVGEVLENKFDVYTVMYQDEWLIHGMDLNAKEVVGFIENQLGVDIDKDKSILEPTTELEFFGLRVHSVKQTVRINDETRDILIECMKHINQYDTREREIVASLWSWVAYHHRLPRIIEDDILGGKTELLSIVMQKLDIFSPRELKRARRKIFIYADVLKQRMIAYAPEFNVQIDKKIPKVTSNTSTEITALLSAIGSARWALKEFVPDKVDLIVFINCPDAHKELTRGSYTVIQPIMKSFIKLYKQVKSRNVIWHCTQSSASVKELLEQINDLDEQNSLCDLVTQEVSKTQRDNPTGKAKGRQGRSGSGGASSLPRKSSSTDESHNTSRNEDASDLVGSQMEEPSTSTPSKKDYKSVKARSATVRKQSPTETEDFDAESTSLSQFSDEDSLSSTYMSQNMFKCISPIPSEETSVSPCTSLLFPDPKRVADSSVASTTSLELQQVDTPPNGKAISPVSLTGKYELLTQHSLTCEILGNVSTYESPQNSNNADQSMACFSDNGLPTTLSHLPSLFEERLETGYSPSFLGIENEPPQPSLPSLTTFLFDISDTQPASSHPPASNNLISQNNPSSTIAENPTPCYILQSSADTESLDRQNMPSILLGEHSDTFQAPPSGIENLIPRSMSYGFVSSTMVTDFPAPFENLITEPMPSVVRDSSVTGSEAFSEIEQLIQDSTTSFLAGESSVIDSLSEIDNLIAEHVSSFFVGDSDDMDASSALSHSITRESTCSVADETVVSSTTGNPIVDGGIIVTGSPAPSETECMSSSNSTLAYTGNPTQTAFIGNNPTTPVLHETPFPQGGLSLLIEGTPRNNNIPLAYLGNDIPLYQSDRPIPLGVNAKIYLMTATYDGQENTPPLGGLPRSVGPSTDAQQSLAVVEAPTTPSGFNSTTSPTCLENVGALPNHSVPNSQVGHESISHNAQVSASPSGMGTPVMPLGGAMLPVYISVINNFNPLPLLVENVGPTLAFLGFTPPVQLQTGVAPVPAEVSSLPFLLLADRVVTRPMPETRVAHIPDSRVANQVQVIDLTLDDDKPDHDGSIDP